MSSDQDVDAEMIDMTDAMGVGPSDQQTQSGHEATTDSQDEVEVEDSVDDDPFTPDTIETDEIDWSALWDEFSFREENADGSIVVSQTQLVTAIEVSEQDIGGHAGNHIEMAVRDGDLREKRTQGGHIEGYLLEAMLS